MERAARDFHRKGIASVPFGFAVGSRQALLENPAAPPRALLPNLICVHLRSFADPHFLDSPRNRLQVTQP